MEPSVIPTRPTAFSTHPEATDDPATISWALPPGVVYAPARHGSTDADALPTPLRDLFADGTLAALEVGARSVLATLADGHTWRADGARFRTALHLAAENGWPRADTAPHAGASGGGDSVDTSAEAADAALATGVEEVLAGDVAAVIAAHGGAISLDSVEDGIVTLRMAGACSGCPAASTTVHVQIENELRHRFPWVREVRTIDEPRPAGPVARLGNRIRLGLGTPRPQAR